MSKTAMTKGRQYIGRIPSPCGNLCWLRFYFRHSFNSFQTVAVVVLRTCTKKHVPVRPRPP